MPPAHIYDNYYLMSSYFYSKRQRAKLWEWLTRGGEKKKNQTPFTLILRAVSLRPGGEPGFSVTIWTADLAEFSAVTLCRQGPCECIHPRSYIARNAANTLNRQHRMNPEPLQVEAEWKPALRQQPPMFQMKGTFRARTGEMGWAYNLTLKAAILFACSCVLWYLGVEAIIACPLFVWQQFM